MYSSAPELSRFERATGRAGSVIDLIGNTPLVRIRCLDGELADGVEIHAKLEYFNPGGSVKDRAARQIMLDALERGDLADGRTLIDSTSGNTGVAYAMIGAALGVDVALVMPSNVTQARKDLIGAFGAEIIFSDPMEGSDGAIRLVRELVENDGDGRYYYPDQYTNPSNPRAHELSTGPEIFRDTDGRVTHFVAGIGTSGTLMGTSRALKRLNPEIRCYGVEPDSAFHGLEGLKHLESSIVPAIYDQAAHDETIFVETDAGWDMAERLAVDEGIAVGHSCGAALVGAFRVAKSLSEGVVVTIFPDHADRYIEPPRSKR